MSKARNTETVAVETVAQDAVETVTETTVESVTLASDALPTVTKEHVTAFLFFYVVPFMDGDKLTTANEKKALAGAILASTENPFLAKVLSSVIAQYGGIYGARKAATDSRGTFRSDKDKAGYEAGSLLYVNRADSLNVGTFSYTPAK